MRWTLNVSNDEPVGLQVNAPIGGIVTVPGSFDPDMLDTQARVKFDAVIFTVPREELSREQLLAIDAVLKGEGDLL